MCSEMRSKDREYVHAICNVASDAIRSAWTKGYWSGREQGHSEGYRLGVARGKEIMRGVTDLEKPDADH